MTRLRIPASVALLAITTLTLSACQGGRREEARVGAPGAAPAAQHAATQPSPLMPASAVAGAAPPNPYAPAQIRRGRYLVEYGGCNDCHTPWAFSPELGMPAPDMSRQLSGHPEGGPDPGGSIGAGDIGLIGPTFTSFRLPFGTVYSMNLTPDIDTGIGTWTEEMFVSVFRKGRHMGGNGRPVLPPMPFLSVNRLSDEDLVSVFAYLRSLPPIRNSVPSPDVPEEAMWAIRDGFDKLLAMDSPAGKQGKAGKQAQVAKAGNKGGKGKKAKAAG